MANDPKENKKDLTGILDLQKLQAEDPAAAIQNEEQDPFAVNELQAIEQVDEFQSIDQIGMMDHPEQQEESFTATPEEDPFAVNVDQPAEALMPDPFTTDASLEAAPEAALETSPETISEPMIESFNDSQPTDFANDFSVDTESTVNESSPAVETGSLNNLKNYSEKTQGKTNLEVKVNYPFHLKINGTFGPFERDKLLIFITENPIGLNSSELDLQISAGRVFLPRISEYAAVKLVQELRDSGLGFDLQPSDREGNEAATKAPASLSFHYQNNHDHQKSSQLSEIPVLSASSSSAKSFTQIDEVNIVQFVRTEMLEVENSPMIQEVIERMTEALKQKARLKGGNALFSLKQEITPLRLPSQYQISLTASVVKI